MWVQCIEYPDYEVNEHGEIRHILKKNIITPNETTGGHLTVRLRHINRTHTVSLAGLVARSFVEAPECAAWYEIPFDTPIHLDGNRGHNAAYNLMWRPRAFAINYQKQFLNNHLAYYCFEIVSTVTGAVYQNSAVASVQLGLLASHIEQSCMDSKEGFYRQVFPTGDEFEYTTWPPRPGGF